MNARRLFHLKKAGASAALEIPIVKTYADIQGNTSLSTLDTARCVSYFGTVNTVDMQVRASCGMRTLTTRIYSREVILRDLRASHWLRVPRVAYERLLSAGSFGRVLPCESGGYSHVDCCCAELDNVYRDASSGDVFHCVVVAVRDGCVRLCRHCTLLFRMGEE